MKTLVMGIGVFVCCYVLGAAMVEFVFMVREKLERDNQNDR
jgi:hypothetical protein